MIWWQKNTKHYRIVIVVVFDVRQQLQRKKVQEIPVDFLFLKMLFLNLGVKILLFINAKQETGHEMIASKIRIVILHQNRVKLWRKNIPLSNRQEIDVKQINY